jgi:hypothetical protein
MLKNMINGNTYGIPLTSLPIRLIFRLLVLMMSLLSFNGCGNLVYWANINSSFGSSFVID